jgi:hypothetical protein
LPATGEDFDAIDTGRNPFAHYEQILAITTPADRVFAQFDTEKCSRVSPANQV